MHEVGLLHRILGPNRVPSAPFARRFAQRPTPRVAVGAEPLVSNGSNPATPSTRDSLKAGCPLKLLAFAGGKGLQSDLLCDPLVQVSGDYGASSIRVLKPLEAVRKRPGMYIGNTGIEGLHHLIAELVDNAVDEVGSCSPIPRSGGVRGPAHVASFAQVMAGHARHVWVDLDCDGQWVTVEDDGRGRPGPAGRQGVERNPTRRGGPSRRDPNGRHAGLWGERPDGSCLYPACRWQIRGRGVQGKCAALLRLGPSTARIAWGWPGQADPDPASFSQFEEKNPFGRHLGACTVSGSHASTRFRI